MRVFLTGITAAGVLLGAMVAVEGAEPQVELRPPKTAPVYQAAPRPEDGSDLALTVEKLEKGFDPTRPFLMWAIGSSYTNFLGDGSQLVGMIRKRFPNAPEIVYKKMVGNAVPYQYIRGWARHLVIPDQPDLVLIYTNGKAEDLEKLVVELREHTTADIIVPTLHWRQREKSVWPDPEARTDMDPPALRAICEKYGVEFAENRREWGDYLAKNALEIDDLLKDAVHQSPYGAWIINSNIARHIHRAERFHYDPRSRERRLEAEASDALKAAGDWQRTRDGSALTAGKKGASIEVSFTGNRIDLVGRTFDAFDVFQPPR